MRHKDRGPAPILEPAGHLLRGDDLDLSDEELESADRALDRVASGEAIDDIDSWPDGPLDI